MKKLSRFICLQFAVLSMVQYCSAGEYEPSILVLSPYKVTYDIDFQEEIAELNREIEEDYNEESNIDTSRTEEEGNNVKIMKRNMLLYTKSMNFQKSLSFGMSDFLTYTFFDRFKNLLVLIRDVQCDGDYNHLKDIASKEGVRYVVNIKRIHFYKQLGANFAKANIQLYDSEVNEAVVDTEYIGDGKNRGFEFTCRENTLQCNVNNILARSTKDIISYVMSNSPTIIKEKKLKSQREFILQNNYLSKPYDKNFVYQIVPTEDASINLGLQYYTFVDESKTKFLSFFIEEVSREQYKQRMEDKKEKNVQIFHKGDLSSGDFLDETPSLNAFIVKGALYKGKWYYKKSSITYFDEPTIEIGKVKYFNNLQRWNFFRNNSEELNPEFWVEGQFKIIKDLTKDSLWSQYGHNMWESEERENRGYIGMYDFIADFKKDSIKQDLHIKDSIVGNNVFIPFYESLLKKLPNEYVRYSFLYDEVILIYPMERSMFLSPVMITDKSGKNKLRFFVTFAGSEDVYEWTYFEPKVLEEKQWHFGSEVVEVLSKLTKWNFAYNSLDDSNFWNEYVFAKQNGKYRYLVQVP